MLGCYERVTCVRDIGGTDVRLGPSSPPGSCCQKAMNTQVTEQPQMGGTCGTLPHAPHMFGISRTCVGGQKAMDAQLF